MLIKIFILITLLILIFNVSLAALITPLIAAVNAGCDAVYLGMNKFGARAYAENFNLENLKDAIEYCHLHNVKIYVTMNTIIFETFEEAVSYCYEKAVAGDAVLLSPACASWGMFTNYEERGILFKEYVNELK